MHAAQAKIEAGGFYQTIIR